MTDLGENSANAPAPTSSLSLTPPPHVPGPNDTVPTKSDDPTTNHNHVNGTKTGSVASTNEIKNPSENDLLLSHIMPPSHILADGRFINLPPPTLLERSAFFERAVAAHRLIKGDDGDPVSSKSDGKNNNNNRKRQQQNDNGEGGGEDSTQQPQSSDGRRKKKSKKVADATFVHPIAIASARLNAKGVDELSKAINLGSLVIGGEYFGLTNVVNQRLVGSKQNTDGTDGADGSKVKDDGTSDGVGSAGTGASSSEGAMDESILLDQRLRSKYVLRRRQNQYDNASTVLSRHERRLSSSVAVRRILDARVRSLRKKWRLVAPEHGTRTVGPVRPREVVAVDVEVYDRDRLGGGNRATSGGEDASATAAGQSNSGGLGHSLGRIARRVPRFATMELDNDYDVTEDILALRKKIKDVVEELKKIGNKKDKAGKEDGKTPQTGITVIDIDDDDDEEEEAQTNNISPDESEICKTKAEPFAIADPTLGKIDPDFDPDKVPLLTLLFEIEKPSTGFSQRVTLSSSFSSLQGVDDQNDGGDNKQLHPDERVIEALQHSLFCASLFESMRAEIIPAPTSSTSSAASGQQMGNKSVAWLSSEMEESFLPPPSVMAGEDTSTSGEARLLCVIHCHEGEVKVQLDAEYSLTVKLIEAGTAAAAASTDSGVGDNATSQQSKPNSDGCGISGSQSPAQLKTLCRALLLHSQSLYHEHRMKMRKNRLSPEKPEEKPAMGFARVKKEVKMPSPHILQSCVGLGCKIMFEKKVRTVLKNLSQWLTKDMNCEDKISIEWFPLALFDSHSRFVLLFRNLCMDIGIYGDVLRVTQTCDTGEYKTVAFGSDSELEYFLKLELRREIRV